MSDLAERAGTQASLRSDWPGLPTPNLQGPLAIDGRALPVMFFAPMKPPDHPVPSGDRAIARLLCAALAKAGAAVTLASSLRLIDTKGDTEAQSRIEQAAAAEVARIVAENAAPARLWLTYHCHYKAPDLVGHAVAKQLGLPYAIVEPSISPRRREGPWARFAEASEAAIAAADRLFWTTERDRPALDAEGHAARMVHLPPFIDTGPTPQRLGAPVSRPLRLLAVGMMRPGDKIESYRRLAASLHHLEAPWSLTIAGDGPCREEVATLFADFNSPGPAKTPERRVSFVGVLGPEPMRSAMESADLMVWPGVGEGVGMAWLEAEAAGLPVVAEDGPAARSVVTGRLAMPGNARAFAEAIRSAAEDRAALSISSREAVVARHGLDAAAERLGVALLEILR
ncbi:MAG: glycosyltransferase family 4 protein [Pseudomonadota bacterium]